ncbi:hypothetical protein X777_08099, partial [Ooceraea biroi]
RLGTSAVSTLLKLQGVKDLRATWKWEIDERKEGRLEHDVACIMKKTVV